MKTTTTQLALSLLCLTALSITACKKDKPAPNENVITADNSTYVLAITADGSSSEATDYILQSADLMNGLITPVGQGIEQKSYRMYELVGKTLLSITYQGTNVVPGYEVGADGKLVKKPGEFSILRLHARNAVDENTMLGLNVPRDGSPNATLYEINATSMSVAKDIKLNVFEPAGNGVEWAYFNDVRKVGNKVYLPFFQIKNNLFETAYTDTAYIAVYTYPDFKLEKVMKDARTGTVGAYATNDAMQITESGDIYTYSPCALASGNAPSNKPSGILKIKNGTTEFDKDYFFNIEQATGGYKIACMKYVGNGKALAQIYSFKDHVPADKYTNRDCRLAIIDLNAKTVNYVNGAPLHIGGMKYNSIVDRGNVYLQIKNADGVYIYKVDMANAQATKGAQVQGKTVMGFFKMSL